jgi:hypothetical protein
MLSFHLPKQAFKKLQSIQPNNIPLVALNAIVTIFLTQI